MRDAIGGTVNLVIIVAFIVIVLSYLAFNVNYTKAFRMKNKIIATYEDYEGECMRGCRDAIRDYARDVGYNPGSMSCEAGWNKWNYNGTDYFCYKDVLVNKRASDESVEEKGQSHYYKIATRINIEIPIIQNFFGYQFFWVTGDTRSFTKD